MPELTDHDLLVETHTNVSNIKESLDRHIVECASDRKRIGSLETSRAWAKGAAVGAAKVAGVVSLAVTGILGLFEWHK